MFLWFLGTALATVWYVFRDDRFDVRPLALGAVLPELDGLLGGASVMHSLAFSLILLLVVMVATMGRRAARKRWLGLPIGTMLHLVFDGAWADAHVFGWPFGGWSLGPDRIDFLDEHVRTGDNCSGERAVVRWTVNGHERSGDPAAYKLFNDDVIAVAFVPSAQDLDRIGKPPSVKRLDTTAPTPTTIESI